MTKDRDLAEPAAARSANAVAFERGRRAWPGIELSFEQYATFLRERGLTRLGALEGEPHADVYLACACVLGVPAAREALDRSVMSDVPKAVRRVRSEPDFVADVTADLRLALLSAEGGEPSALERYQGKGPLRSFVMVLAMRRAIDRVRRQKEVLMQASALDVAVESPSVARMDSGELRDAFLLALRERLAALPARDRNVLRLHVVDGVPAEAIARMYGVHRGTVTRWIASVKRAVFEETQAALQRDLNVSPATFQSFARDAAVGLDASLSTFLRDPSA